VTDQQPGTRLLELVGVMDRLRRQCPWDREQTHRSLARYLLEETYETLEAIDNADQTHLQEELGDLLLQVFFHARIAAEQPDGFDIDDVAGGIVDKLVYRHPHVFAGLEVTGADEVNRNWETLKAAEKQRSSVLEGIPTALPALSYADKVLSRLSRPASAEPASAEPASAEPASEPVETPLGDRLLALVREARASGLDAEQELRDAVRRLVADA
jgi:XTP/dITP diphosphohydrolase